MKKENINLQELGLALINKLPEIIGAFTGKTVVESLIDKVDKVDSSFMICLFMVIMYIVFEKVTDFKAMNES